jgi:mRNA interferase MazF
MKEGNVIVVPMPQADGIVKNRPAIVLREMPPFLDVLICGVSTQLRQAAKDFDEVISANDADFVASGLMDESLIKLGFLAVVARSKVIGSIGSISSERHKRLLQKLSDYQVSRSPSTSKV